MDVFCKEKYPKGRSCASMRPRHLGSCPAKGTLLLVFAAHDSMDGGGRATQDAKAENFLTARRAEMPVRRTAEKAGAIFGLHSAKRRGSVAASPGREICDVYARDVFTPSPCKGEGWGGVYG